METQSQAELSGQKRMLPPPAGTFQDREDLINHVRDFGATQGYVVTIKKSRKDRRVILGCDRGGVYRNRRKMDESKRKRKACSRLINCPFEALGKKEDDAWVLTIKNGEHNHEPLKDMSEHPYSRRFTEDEVRQIKLMTEAGVKPRQVLKTLKQINPELQSTPRHLYNLKAKIRQGNLSDKSFKSWRPNRSVPINTNGTSGELLMNNDQLAKVPNFIGGKFVDSHGTVVFDVINPATQEIISQVPSATYEEFKDAVNVAKQAFHSWKNTSVTSRQRIMFKLQELIHRNIDKLAMKITMEKGMTLKSAKGDVLCGLEVVEHACGVATCQMGEFIPNASNGIDTYCIREPLGVCAGICPSNFPAMTPLWMFPIAITCGNTFVLKPCEKNPGTSIILAALAKEAGLPDGVLNIVHGANDIVNYICDDEDIKAISLVGSNMAGMHVYARAASRGKRIQSNVGGKNHAIIMPDASIHATLNALVAGGFGDAGQRSMGLTTAVFVGGSMQWEEELMERAKALKVNAGSDPAADVGPVISKEVKDHINRLVQNSVEGGARLLLDGRNIVVPGYENGNFIGPTIICDVTSNMECYKEEIVGPVLLCMQADSLEEAITIVNRNKSVNGGASIFTTSGYAARKFQNEIESGLVGINVPVPVPIPTHFCSLNGLKASFTGDLSFCGKSGVHFYTHIKMVAQQWRDLPCMGVSSGLHPSSETDMASRGGVSSALPPSSERDSTYQRASRALSPESEGNSPSHALLLSSQGDPAITSVPSTADDDLPNHGASLVIPPTSQMENREASLTIPLGREKDLSNQGASSQSERMYTPQTSHWNETSQRSESERIYIPITSQRSNNPTVRSSDTSIGLTHDGAYVPTSHKNDSVVPISPISHRNENLCPPSERTYMNMMATSHLRDSMGQTFHRTDASVFPSSERLYTPATTSGTPAPPPPPHRNDNIASSSSHQVDSMPQNSETMYMPPIVHTNAGMPPTERLYMPATSQRMYGQSQNTIVSMDVDYPSQGPPMTLPTSQRI